MARQKKNGNQKAVESIILVTAILNLIKAIADLIGKFLE